MKTNESSMDVKEFYIEAIIKMLRKCNDIPLVHLIYTLLCKNV